MNTHEIASKGRNGDTMLMHVAPAEVAGLESLARANGTRVTKNPDTGLPEAFAFIPLLAGLGAKAMGLGALGTGALVGGTTAAATGSLEKGLMAGLTAGGMSALGGGLAEAGGAPVTDPTMAANTQQFAQGIDPNSMMTPAEMSAKFQADVAANPANYGYTPQTVPEFSSVTTGPYSGMNPDLYFKAPTATFEQFGNLSGADQAAYTMPSSPINNAVDAGNMMTPFDTGVAPDAMVQSNAPGMSEYVGAEVTTPGADMSFGQELQYQGQGLRNITQSPEAFGDFVSKNQYGIGAAGTGMAGSADIDTREAAEQEKADKEAEKDAQRRAVEQRILANYAAVGREAPTPIGGGSLFEKGGQVKQPQPPRKTPAEAAEEEKRRLQFSLGGLKGSYRLAEGGLAGLTRGNGDGTSDSIPAEIDNREPAALSTDEFVVPADVVSHIGNGSTNAGARQLYAMMDRIREARTGNSNQPSDINAGAYLPA